jgi:hypothetical protein
MTIYTCERCHYETKLKTDYVRHLQKKNKCRAHFSNVEPEVILEGLMEPKQHKCQYCEKSFSYPFSLSRHCASQHINVTTNTNCNNTTNNDNHSVNHSHNTTNNITNNITNNNNINPIININIRPFGNETLEHILNDEDFKTKCLKEIKARGIPNMASAIWLNDEVPENQNVKFKTSHIPQMVNIVNENGKWVEENAFKITEKMVMVIIDVLRGQADKLYHDDTENFSDGFTKSDVYDQRTENINNIKTKKRNSGFTQARDTILIDLKAAKRK